MKFYITICGFLLLAVSNMAAQTAAPEMNSRHRCATPVPDAAWNKWFNQRVEEYKQASLTGKAKAANFVIPIIVHVIHGGQNIGNYPNISQAQVNSQLPTLNADFAGTGFNVGNVPAVFASLVVNTGISFCFAKLDPNGNCLSEPGIDRVDYRTISGASNPAGAQSAAVIMGIMDNFIKPATIWDPSRYLNVWVTDVGNAAQVLGYATMPGGANLTGLGSTGSVVNDGVWVWGKAFGSNGAAQAPYNRGRTLTHEIGHWLGLRHVWGDAICGTDFCNDTPPSEEDNFGCPAHPYKLGVCSGNTTGEMFMNFMDYSNDACLYMFTPDQNARMQTAMTTGSFRTQLNASSAVVCNEPATADPVATFSLSHYSHCVDSIITVTNSSSGGPCPAMQWMVTPSGNEVFMKGTTSTYGSPSLRFKAPGTYTLTLDASNASGNSSMIEIITIYDCFNSVGLNTASKQHSHFALWPNPAQNEFIVRTTNPQQPLRVNIYNALGQLVSTEFYAKNNEKVSVNIEKLPEGVYMVNLDDGAHPATKRLIISR